MDWKNINIFSYSLYHRIIAFVNKCFRYYDEVTGKFDFFRKNYSIGDLNTFEFISGSESGLHFIAVRKRRP